MSIEKCYYCNKELAERDMVIKPIPLVCKNGKKRNYKRKFHINCVEKFVAEHEDEFETKKETSEWDKVYKYFKLDVLCLPEDVNLPDFATKRLLGLRVGKFMPNAINTRVIKQGHSFSTILATMKLANIEIQKAFKTQAFSDMQHKINLAMFVINKHIDFVEERIRKVEEINSKNQEIEFKKPTVAKYIKKSKKRNFDFI
ncbi:hypothetical protein G6O70_00250 (plasmid) [Liquorilactobacillus hordei DSM 19519]|nr:hypothetical protein G6O70_00250 [Liquorilactobacillus hordei DSM 19519]